MDKVCSKASRFINGLRQARNFATQVAPASRLANVSFTNGVFLNN